jgi:hypothetical protein
MRNPHRPDLGAASRRAAAALAALAITLLSPGADAIPTATFEAGTFKELDKGKPKGTLISSEGEVVAGRRSTPIKKVGVAMVWCSARVGQSVYFGTGKPARIITVSGGNKVRVVADFEKKKEAVLITAMIATPAGKLIVGTMPDARLLEVDPGTGKWRELTRLKKKAKHIWSLAYDRTGARVFIGSGSPGKVFSVPAAGGKPTLYYDTSEHHVLSLAIDGAGKLLAGSNDKAILYRITAKGKATAVHDFDATEVRDVVVTKTGRIYVAVNKFRRKTGGLPRYDRPTKGTGTAMKKAKARRKQRYRQSELRPGAKTGKGALYRIEPDGRTDQLISLPKGYFTRLAIDPQGRVWAADGTKGRVYIVRRNRTVLTAFDLRERQALVLAVGGKQQFLGTGDAGGLYRLGGAAKRPAYLSDVLDAKFVADWGSLTFRGTGPLSWSSRSGNTANPDKTWNAWRATRRGAGRRVRVVSPRARYLQLRAEWRGAGSKSVLRSFKLFYRPQNQRARVTSIEIKRPKRKAGKAREPAIELKWKVDNDDKDQLVYYLHYREENGVTWHRIRTVKPITKTKHKWNTETVPDGTYRVRITASDERANAPELTQKGRRISAPVLVDNRRPAVVGLSVRDPWISGIARDTYSRITKVEFSIDGKPWRIIGASDGIYDTPSEPFRVRLPRGLRPGEHNVTVRAYDGANNVGVAQQRFVK